MLALKNKQFKVIVLSRYLSVVNTDTIYRLDPDIGRPIYRSSSTLDPIGRFRTNLFSSLCMSKGHPPKRVLSELFEQVKHCKQKSTKSGIGGNSKLSLCENFFSKLKKILFAFLLRNKKFITATFALKFFF